MPLNKALETEIPTAQQPMSLPATEYSYRREEMIELREMREDVRVDRR